MFVGTMDVAGYELVVVAETESGAITKLNLAAKLYATVPVPSDIAPIDYFSCSIEEVNMGDVVVMGTGHKLVKGK